MTEQGTQQAAQKQEGMFRDGDGNKSSKRIVGTLLVVAGALLHLFIGVMSVQTQIGDPDTAIRAGNALVMTGGALIGSGLGEKFAKARSR
jgi:hypothetical protein